MPSLNENSRSLEQLTKMDRINELTQSVDALRNWVIEQDAIKRGMKSNLKQMRKVRKALKIDQEELSEAAKLINAAVSATQHEVKEFIEDVVSLALKSVYGEEYGFELEFLVRRDQSEISSFITKGDLSFAPNYGVGGGFLDVISFALRLVIWALSTNSGGPYFILDEPFRHVSRDKIGKIANMLKALSGLMNIQLIIISHDEGLIETADRAWLVKNTDGEAIVEQL